MAFGLKSIDRARRLCWRALVVVLLAAQVAVGVGPGGASVRVGEPHRHWHERDRYVYRDHCRTVRERIVTPSGRVIYKSTRVCG